jgi:hypothetical protein
MSSEETNIFEPHLVESLDMEPTDMEGQDLLRSICRHSNKNQPTNQPIKDL